jgi:hypothetical protein
MFSDPQSLLDTLIDSYRLVRVVGEGGTVVVVV